MPASSPSSARLRARVRRILWFGARTVFTVIWWELVLRRVLGHERVNRGALERYRRIAREFRDLSVSMGGVLIKVGQFVSSRVDVLPRAITDELADLQDEVPPEKFEDIRAVVEEELGKPLEEAFAFFDPHVEAAASLGQVHHARLLTGENVVVKVQRPGITLIVATDLSAVRTVLGWIRNYGPIRRRVDLIALLDEFSRILYQELDYVQEAENAANVRRQLCGRSRRVHPSSLSGTGDAPRARAGRRDAPSRSPTWPRSHRPAWIANKWPAVCSTPTSSSFSRTAFSMPTHIPAICSSVPSAIQPRVRARSS